MSHGVAWAAATATSAIGDWCEAANATVLWAATRLR